MKAATQRRRKQFHFGEAKRNIHCNATICTACMNINKLSRVKYWGGGALTPRPPGSYAYATAKVQVVYNAKHREGMFGCFQEK